MNSNVGFSIAFIISIACCGTGCSQSQISKTWHDKFNWRAEEFFEDPKVISLCRAIEKNDFEAIDRLVAEGADVAAIGKGNMTPLLWAFPDNKPDRFKRILAHGGDPNVLIQSDFNTKNRVFQPGDSVTMLAARTHFEGYLAYVLDHRGDPNIVDPTTNQTPVFAVIEGPANDKKKRIQLLVDKGADLNRLGTSATPAGAAVVWGGQFDLALFILEAGADPSVYFRDELTQLAHLVVRAETNLAICSPQQQKDYHVLVNWLDEHGVSLEDARADIARRSEWPGTPEKYSKMAKQEVAERKAREANEENSQTLENSPNQAGPE